MAFVMKNMAYWKAKNGNSPLNKISGVGSKNKSDSKSFDIDYDEIKKDGSNNYSDPTDPKSPTYKPNHPGSDFVKPSKKKQVALSEHEDKKGTMITGGNESEVKADLEDRIEFLQSDIDDGNTDPKVKSQLAKLKKRLNN